MKTIEMHLNDESFELVKNGQKTVELRVYDEKRRQVDMGDGIVFINKDDKVSVKVTGLFIASSFELLFSKIGWIKAGWSENDNEDKRVTDLRKLYTEEEEKEWGVVGIEFKSCKLD